jgi:hypothetical protein
LSEPCADLPLLPAGWLLLLLEDTRDGDGAKLPTSPKSSSAHSISHRSMYCKTVDQEG